MKHIIVARFCFSFFYSFLIPRIKAYQLFGGFIKSYPWSLPFTFKALSLAVVHKWSFSIGEYHLLVSLSLDSDAQQLWTPNRSLLFPYRTGADTEGRPRWVRGSRLYRIKRLLFDRGAEIDMSWQLMFPGILFWVRCTFVFNERTGIQCGPKHLVAGLVKCC
jgi:hypothetical protein